MKRLNKTKLTVFIVLILGVLGLIVLLTEYNKPSASTTSDRIKQFSSINEISDFLKTKQDQGYYGGYGLLEATALKATSDTTGAPEPAAKQSTSASSTYSTTNIQVEGVDEADIVKNDGKYIYIVSGNKINIIDAYPASNADLLFTIDINGTPDEIFLNKDKLIVFGRENYNYGGPIPLGEDVVEANTAQGSSGLATSAKIAAPSSIFPPIYYNPKSFVKIYDVSDRTLPKLYNSITYDGDYYDSRMIGDTVYAILNQPIIYRDDVVVMPEIKASEKSIAIAPSDVYYFDYPDYSYRLTTVLALDINSKADPQKKSFLTGYTQNIFVSENNIYLTSQKQISYLDYQEKLTRQVMLELVDSSTAQKIAQVLDDSTKTTYEKQQEVQALFETYYNKLPEEQKQEILKRSQEKTKEIETQIQKELQKTTIHKIQIKDQDIDYKARGEVPGAVLNQFSMDEYKNYFRIATTTGEVSQDTSLNHIYVLDDDLNIVGKLENLAPKEKIFSARFIGNRVYLVTFKNIDPLFVIDLSNPTDPKVLGELKIPGFSNYLHPYDEDHIIGIGKEAVDASDSSRNFAYYQGIKIALFDISDVSNPKEISKFNIGDRGSDSQALYDHKAFLFDKNKGILVMPVSVAQIKPEQYPDGIPEWAYGQVVFQGAYVLNINLEDGITYKGRITHDDGTRPDYAKGDYYYVDYLSQVQRSLYIDNTLYTISQKYVKANDLGTLDEIKTIKLPVPEQSPVVIY